MNPKPDRKCGSCGACCVVLGVPGLKEPQTPCPHMKSCGTNRCRIHASPEKPDVCSTYSCMWLQGHFQAHDRPDEIDMIFDGHEKDGDYIVTAREVRPGSSRTPRAAQLIDSMAAGLVVIVVPHDNGKRRLVCKNRAIVEKLRPRLANLGIRV
jgi:hypothetical protein